MDEAAPPGNMEATPYTMSMPGAGTYGVVNGGKLYVKSEDRVRIG
jgi:hypothetical protein